MIKSRENTDSLKEVLRVSGPRGQHWVGNGFPVRQMFGYNDLGRELSPFLLLDYAGPAEFTPSTERRGVGAHPHRGFETVTIVYSGGVEHRDSVGNRGEVGPLDVQWMTAGSGVLHEEMHSTKFQKSGGVFELVQLWVNLPAKQKMTQPGYQTLKNTEIPEIVSADGSSRVRIIAGDFASQKGPAKTHTPINIWDVALRSGSVIDLVVPKSHTAAVFCIQGELIACGTEELLGPQMAIFDKERPCIRLQAKSDSKVLFLGGLPIPEPMIGLGPFVMNTKEELHKAFEDYESGQFGNLD